MSRDILPNNSENYGTPATEAGNFPVAPYNTAADEPIEPIAITTVNATTVSAQVLAANFNRKGVTIENEGTAAALVAYATTATTSAYTVSIPSGGYWEMPDDSLYTGSLSVITSTGTATLRVTERS